MSTALIDPRVVSIKSRLIPLEMRPDPPLLASTALLTAYNHVRHPTSFDAAAEAREKQDAQNRLHPGVQHDAQEQKSTKEAWNEQVNWVMNERRIEKLRNLNEEREKRLRALATLPDEALEQHSESHSKRSCVADPLESRGIFSVPAPADPPARTPTPALNVSTRPNSPRRLHKRHSVISGIGEYSPRTKRTTYTPPRILPSGDETAPVSSASPSPVPSSLRFDFVSPLGPTRGSTTPLGRSGSMSRINLEAVKEEDSAEAEGEQEWTLVQRKPVRSGSAPCRDRREADTNSQSTLVGMEVEVS